MGAAVGEGGPSGVGELPPAWWRRLRSRRSGSGCSPHRQALSPAPVLSEGAGIGVGDAEPVSICVPLPNSPFGRISLGVDHPREGGVFGGWAPGRPVATLVFYGLYALQHRGQGSAGMAVADGCGMLVYREMGLVSEVFDEATLATRQDHLAIGHTRDSTTGSWETAQPAFKTNAAGGGIVVVHNGNLTNTAALAGAPDSGAAGPGGRPVAGEGHRPHHGPSRGPHRDRRPCPDRSRQGAVHDLVYGGLSGPGPGCGGPGRHPPPTATQPSTLPLSNPELEVAR
jgi:hypothetical protein